MDVAAVLEPLSFATPRGEPGTLRLGFLLAANGDPDALALLYDALSRDLYGFALWSCGEPELAEDAVQEVFCHLAAGAVSDPSRVKDPRAWLLASTRHAVLDMLRERRREVALDAADLFALQPSPEQTAEARRVARAVCDLPRKLREALYLRHFGELTFAEIGRVLGVPTFTAASRYRLGLASLRRRMGVGE